MISFAKNIWIWEQPQSFYGLQLGTRMTIIRLQDNALVVHSPVQLTDTLISELGALGQVRYIVCPNKFHHLYVGAFKKQYPEALLFCAPGLEKKRTDIAFDGVISNNQTFPWNPELSHTLIEGIPLVNEVVFFHSLSRSLIITDLALHMRETSHFLTKMLLKLMGAYGHFGLSRMERWVFIRSRNRFQKSLRTVNAWDFERIALAHGTLVEAHGKRRFTEAFAEDLNR